MMMVLLILSILNDDFAGHLITVLMHPQIREYGESQCRDEIFRLVISTVRQIKYITR